MKISILQLDAIKGDYPSRVNRALDLTQKAQGDLICLPELWAVSFLSFDQFYQSAETIDGPLVSQFKKLARNKKCYISMGSFVEKEGENYYNTSVILDPTGNILSTYRKIHLFTFAGGEADLLTPGKKVSVASTPWGVFGLATCYDLRFPEQFRTLNDKGVNIIIAPSAWPLKRVDHFRLFCQSRAVENLSFMIACNCAGGTDSQQLAGSSMVISPFGDTILQAATNPQTYELTINLDEIKLWQNKFSALKDRKKEPFWHDQ